MLLNISDVVCKVELYILVINQIHNKKVTRIFVVIPLFTKSINNEKISYSYLYFNKNTADWDTAIWHCGNLGYGKLDTAIWETAIWETAIWDVTTNKTCCTYSCMIFSLF